MRTLSTQGPGLQLWWSDQEPDPVRISHCKQGIRAAPQTVGFLWGILSVVEQRRFERSQARVSSPTSKNCALKRLSELLKTSPLCPTESWYLTATWQEDLCNQSVWARQAARVKGGLRSHTQFRVIRWPISSRSSLPIPVPTLLKWEDVHTGVKLQNTPASSRLCSWSKEVWKTGDQHCKLDLASMCVCLVTENN